ncbi:hypothetical protein VTG60DRAFT_5121 [Thermothelomyces hinnuleus]
MWMTSVKCQIEGGENLKEQETEWEKVGIRNADPLQSLLNTPVCLLTTVVTAKALTNKQAAGWQPLCSRFLSQKDTVITDVSAQNIPLGCCRRIDGGALSFWVPGHQGSVSWPQILHPLHPMNTAASNARLQNAELSKYAAQYVPECNPDRKLEGPSVILI